MTTSLPDANLARPENADALATRSMTPDEAERHLKVMLAVSDSLSDDDRAALRVFGQEMDRLRKERAPSAKSPATRFWRYGLPSTREPFGDWAVVFLDEKGTFATESAYGGYGYFWGAHGCRDFREFVMSLGERSEFTYAEGKLHYGRRQVFYGHETEMAVRRHICESRRGGGLDRDEARAEYDLVRSSGIADGGDYEFGCWYMQTKLDCAHEFATYVTDPQVVAFCKDILPRLAVLLRAELTAEGYFAQLGGAAE